MKTRTYKVTITDPEDVYASYSARELEDVLESKVFVADDVIVYVEIVDEY